MANPSQNVSLKATQPHPQDEVEVTLPTRVIWLSLNGRAKCETRRQRIVRFLTPSRSNEQISLPSVFPPNGRARQPEASFSFLEFLPAFLKYSTLEVSPTPTTRSNSKLTLQSSDSDSRESRLASTLSSRSTRQHKILCPSVSATPREGSNWVPGDGVLVCVFNAFRILLK